MLNIMATIICYILKNICTTNRLNNIKDNS